MLQRIEALSAQGTVLNLPLEDLDNGLLVEEISGLDPVKATITSSSFAQLDGSSYQSSRREERNIVLKVSLEPDWAAGQSVRDLRKQLYAVFMSKSAVTLKFYMSDGNPVWISGRVESFETDLFSAEPAVDISVICFDPDFYDPTSVITSGLSTATTTETIFNYDGTVETGAIFTIRPNRALPTFSLYVVNGEGAQQLDFTGALQTNDVLKISTVPGSKYARLTRAGVETSYLYGITPQSAWLEFQPGENRVRMYAAGAGIPFDVEYTRKYGGL
jgi:hypothetical protein